jgi:hypothetical protein
MPDTFTTNLLLTKPEIGASTDTWGNKTNANWDSMDALFPSGALAVTAGGTGGTTAADGRTGLGLGSLSTQAADSVAITGGTAVLSSLTASGAAPVVKFNETDGGTNAKVWSMVADSGVLSLRLYNDLENSYANAFTVTRAAAALSSLDVPGTLTVSSNVVYHAGNMSSATITESQIQDAAILARVGSSETITGNWSFTGAMTKTGQGRIPYLVGSTNTGGAITISSSAASGTPANGDLWIQYVP